MRIRIVCKRPPQPEQVPGSPFRSGGVYLSHIEVLP